MGSYVDVDCTGSQGYWCEHHHGGQRAYILVLLRVLLSPLATGSHLTSPR